MLDDLGEAFMHLPWEVFGSWKTWVFIIGLLCVIAGLLAPVGVGGMVVLLVVGVALLAVWAWSVIQRNPDRQDLNL